MRCTACRYDKCVSVGMVPKALKSDSGEERDEEVEILLDSKSDSKPEEEPSSRSDSSQLGEYLKVICCGISTRWNTTYDITDLV